MADNGAAADPDGLRGGMWLTAWLTPPPDPQGQSPGWVPVDQDTDVVVDVSVTLPGCWTGEGQRHVVRANARLERDLSMDVVADALRVLVAQLAELVTSRALAQRVATPGGG